MDAAHLPAGAPRPSAEVSPAPAKPCPPRERGAPRRAVRLLWAVVLITAALLATTGCYTLGVYLADGFSEHTYTNRWTVWGFLVHLLAGLFIVAPFLLAASALIRSARAREERRGVAGAITLMAAGLVAIGTGLLLVQFDGWPVLPTSNCARHLTYGLHLAAPVAAAASYLLARRSGPPIRGRWGTAWATATGVFLLAMALAHANHPQPWNLAGAAEGAKRFEPSNTRTVDGRPIPSSAFMIDQSCRPCHADTYRDWFHSVHHFSSFNNPIYRFSVRETREVALKRDGDVRASRWCAGCHDPVPFLDGAFDDPDYDDVHDPTAHAGVGGAVCHSITHVNSTAGNGDYRNRGDGACDDVAAAAGVAAPLYGMGVTAGDYDNDSRLDLFVCNYITWSPAVDLGQGFQLVGLGRSYGPPTAFEGAQCLLYRNLGEGRFDDVSQQAGIHVFGPIGQPIGKALGVVVFDPNEDGWPDIAVANDTVRHFLFHNTGKDSFEEIGELAGVAYAEGRARGAMGIDWGEYRPGGSAIRIGNFADEPNTFLRLDDARQLAFSDVATAEGVAGPSRLPLKFGAVFLDYDLDGWQDLLTCNGRLEPEIQQVQSRQSYRQPAQLFWNCAAGGNGRRGCFAVVSQELAGPDLFQPLVGRACAYADIDGDGDLDVVLTENGGPARLLRNDGGNRHHWLRLVLQGDGKRSNATALGARITLEAGGRTLHRELTGARGYLSQGELVVTFGLRQTAKIDRVHVIRQ